MTDTVFVATHRGAKIYHTTDCYRAPNEPTERDRQTLEDWGYRQCQICAENNEALGNNGVERSSLHDELLERDEL